MKKYCFVLRVMLSFSELEFKWSIHVIDASINYMLPILDLLTVYNDLFLSWL